MRASLDVAPPEYVAPLYLYLASELASQVTGQTFAAAGGFVGRYPRPDPALIGYRDHHE
jgi:NAD(P)-dependent dehydrogenase (short-subunit alcohol dehydrogenase family)